MLKRKIINTDFTVIGTFSLKGNILSITYSKILWKNLIITPETFIDNEVAFQFTGINDLILFNKKTDEFLLLKLIKLVKFNKLVIDFQVNLPYPNSNLEISNKITILGECTLMVNTTAVGLNQTQVFNIALSSRVRSSGSPLKQSHKRIIR